jgi:hypothetical protein
MSWGRAGIDYQTSAPEHTVERIHAMIWTSSHGTRLLADVLSIEYGLADQLAGWSLVSAASISANGNVIAGVGVNPLGKFQGWVVYVPEPTTPILALCLAAVIAFHRQRRPGRRPRHVPEIR